MQKFSYLTFLIIFLSQASLAQNISDYKLRKANGKVVFDLRGNVNLNGSYHKQNEEFNNDILPDQISKNYLDRDFLAGLDSQIFLEAAVQNKIGLKYGFLAKFETNYNVNKRYQSPHLDQNFLFLNGDFGKFEFGNYIAANQFLKEGPSRIVRGAGGVNGKYLEYVNLPMAQKSASICSNGVFDASCAKIKLPKFILLSQSPIAHGGGAKGFYSRHGDNSYLSGTRDYSDFNRSNFRSINDDSFEGVEDATKLTYYTPRISGVKFGVSYAPRSGNNGLTKNTALDVDDAAMKNMISASLSYVKDFDNLFLAISSGIEKANFDQSSTKSDVRRDDLLAYDFGITASYFGASIALNYGIWQRYLQAKKGIYSCDYDPSLNLANQNCSSNAKKFSKPYYASAAISYEFGPFGTSLSALKSEFEKNKYYAISLDFDYKLSRNLKTYFGATKFDFNSNQVKAADILDQDSIANSQRQLQNNDGYVFLTGFLFSF